MRHNRTTKKSLRVEYKEQAEQERRAKMNLLAMLNDIGNYSLWEFYKWRKAFRKTAREQAKAAKVMGA